MEAAAGGGWDLNSLVAVLTQGEGQLRQLCECMAARSTVEQEKQLVLRAQSCFRTAICMAKAADSDLLQAAAAADSSRSNSGCSANSERALKEQQRKEICKKRKTLRKWTIRVRLLGLDGHDDGFSWRKYGQKDILGAKHPRAYFRCTFRNASGCPAMKQVQRSDDDPFVIDVTYRGDHNCRQSKKPQPGAGEARALSSEPEQQQPPPDRQLLLSLQTSLKVETEGCSSDDQDHNCFSFASTPASGAFSPPFVSPTTPESSSFWLSSGFADLFSAVTPANDYSSDVDFMLNYSAGFAAASPFDTSAFFHDSEV